MTFPASPLHTSILPADSASISVQHTSGLEDLELSLPENSETFQSIRTAVAALKDTNVPVAFPTETVYGLGADATRSSAVRGIYAAKNRPIDNPLIVHICSLRQLCTLLGSSASSSSLDPIPKIYKPLIQRFWPGPLTILLPVSSTSTRKLAPEVTAGLQTFGARMPSAPLALALLRSSDLPLAAPSANASTRPSPTRSEHVLHDLRGRIEYIVDGGSCDVGVESTVVDGLSEPPAVLRPGGVSLEEIRQIPGWEHCVKGYKDHAEGGEEGRKETNGVNGASKGSQDDAPRAPGMKYKHYSPTAKVALVKPGLVGSKQLENLVRTATLDNGFRSVAILRSKQWAPMIPATDGTTSTLKTNGVGAAESLTFNQQQFSLNGSGLSYTVYETQLGPTAVEMARWLFHALRELDLLNVEIIFVEGLDDAEDQEAAAVMNRLRKAAEIKINDLPWKPGRTG